MARMTGFIFQDEYLKKLVKLSDQELGRLIRALATYHATGEEQELAGRESIAYDFIKADIDRIDSQYQAKCETNRNNRQRPSTNNNDRQRPSTNVDKVEVEVEVEREEIEREKDIYTRARDTWLDSFGTEPTPAIIRKLLAVGLSADLTAKAIRVSAGKAPAKPIDYVLSVLNDWRRERIASEDEADEYLLLLDGAAGKLPAVFTAEQAQTELEQFRQRKKAAS